MLSKTMRLKYILSVILIFTFFISANLYAQEMDSVSLDELESESSSGLDTSQIEMQSDNRRVAIALTTAEYPATPGDNYLVVFLRANQEFQVTCTVDLDNTINLGYLGTFNTAGKTFLQVKAEIIKSLYKNYGDCYPRVSILSTGKFRIWVTGEVKRSRFVTLWGLSRLSDIIGQVKTPYTSVRSITVFNKEDGYKTVDLYKAWYDGKLENDPLIRPDTKITFKKLERVVSVGGQVYRPGSYEILASDSLNELIAYYGKGYTDLAYTDELILKRPYAEGGTAGGQTVYIKNGKTADYDLKNHDSVIVRSTNEFLPVFFFQGAVSGFSNKPEAALKTITFQNGLMFSTVVLQNRDLFTPVSDLRNAVYYRYSDGTSFTVDVSKIIYNKDIENDFEIENGDKLFIPVRYTVN